MKTKLICSALLGATICGSAFAISVDDRRAFCEQYPDKYVWVEKTEACIPVNPCESSDANIQGAYCIKAPFAAHKEDFEKYLENYFGKQVKYVKSLDENNYNVGFYTMDGNYFQFNPVLHLGGENTTVGTEVQQSIHAACWVHGYNVSMGYQQDLYEQNPQNGEAVVGKVLGCVRPEIKPAGSKSFTCSDIVQYASEHTGLTCNTIYKDNYGPGPVEDFCIIACN